MDVDCLRLNLTLALFFLKPRRYIINDMHRAAAKIAPTAMPALTPATRPPLVDRGDTVFAEITAMMFEQRIILMMISFKLLNATADVYIDSARLNEAYCLRLAIVTLSNDSCRWRQPC